MPASQAPATTSMHWTARALCQRSLARPTSAPFPQHTFPLAIGGADSPSHTPSLPHSTGNHHVTQHRAPPHRPPCHPGSPGPLRAGERLSRSRGSSSGGSRQLPRPPAGDSGPALQAQQVPRRWGGRACGAGRPGASSLFPTPSSASAWAARSARHGHGSALPERRGPGCPRQTLAQPLGHAPAAAGPGIAPAGGRGAGLRASPAGSGACGRGRARTHARAAGGRLPRRVLCAPNCICLHLSGQRRSRRKQKPAPQPRGSGAVHAAAPAGPSAGPAGSRRDGTGRDGTRRTRGSRAGSSGAGAGARWVAGPGESHGRSAGKAGCLWLGGGGAGQPQANPPRQGRC